ncbi:hypothetical protein JKF63_07850 [Porcisia hertigi]|uniref:C2 domain-containing protein n=1 Tax=Porcisia hertigi TaxID=2761500 RepID=A0A836YGI5_9TRYP|nr:hypothetical protein JKF63_07850 [Porcisia hertigi]
MPPATEQKKSDGSLGVADHAAAAAAGDCDYQPDVENAEQLVAERMRLFQDQLSGVGTGNENSCCDATRLVRRPDRFHCGPVPAWLRVYSDSLLFNRHHLDRDVAAARKSGRAGPKRGCCRVGGNAEGLAQLPADAVVLQLRSDVARVRRWRDELSRNTHTCSIPSLFFPDVYPARFEVYRPAEPNWGAAPATPPMASETAAEAKAVGVGVETVVGSDDAQDKRHAPPPSPLSTPPLSHAMEAKDLRRSLLAQTIPVWRRHGAAIKLLTELLDHLEDRLDAFEAQLKDPVQGSLLILAGAPASAGVDGTVAHTCPSALERAIRTTIANTMMSDVFATSWTALPNRGLRLSEALRRRQTPRVHADYVTVVDARPVYDFTVLQTLRRVDGVASSTPGVSLVSVGPHYQQWRGGGEAGCAAAVGVDTRRSYSVHVDYVRFEPCLEKISCANALGAGLGAGDSVSPAAGAGASAADGSSEGHSSTLSSSVDPLSSLLLGTHSNIFFPCDVTPSGDGSTTNPHAVLSLEQQHGDKNLHSRAMALLLALSAASARNGFVAFNPEEYLISLLLQYYEEYRILQLNLLPVLKNRIFYQEQVQQLQRQSKRSTDIDNLQERLESLARTSADVERGFLHAMILLWNSVLILRRQKRGQGQYGAETLDNATTDVPIIVERRPGHHRGPGGQGRRSRRSESANRHGSHHHPSPTRAAVDMLPRRPILTAGVSTEAVAREEADGKQLEDTHIATSPVVHHVNYCVVDAGKAGGGSGGGGGDDNRVGTACQLQQQRDSRAPSPSSFKLFSGSLLGRRDPMVETTSAASASTSCLLAPVTLVPLERTEGRRSSGSGGGGGGDEECGEEAAPSPWPPQQKHRHHEFRFFLRRSGTFKETPYVVGDDLLDYAAEVEGTDVLRSSRLSVGDYGGAGAPMPRVVACDELVYFQLVVFARSRASMVPQYVGCTTPRPMTSAKVVFFNETFEVRTLREPAELLLHLIPITDGPSKHTVVSTVRLRPTLTRTYTLLPLQPPTAFFFHGRLFARHRRAAYGSNGSAASTAAASTAVQGVLAVSTTWTSSQGMTIPQIERLFIRGSGNTGTVADPLDPHYLPLLRMLRAHYREQDMNRVHAVGGGAKTPSSSRRGHTAGAARRRGAAAARSVPSARVPHDDVCSSAGSRHAHSSSTRRARSAVASLHGRPTRYNSFDPCVGMPTGRASHGRLSRLGRGERRPLQDHPPFGHTAEWVHSADAAAGAGGAPVAVGRRSGHVSSDCYAVEETLERLPSARLRHLHRRWLIHADKIKAANEVEARLFARPMALDDAETYQLQKELKRIVEKEEVDWAKSHGSATGTGGAVLFDVAHYYSAPSAISGLTLSPLPRETKLKLWQERQRRLLLTLKARRHLTDAEKFETVVRVPKLAPKRVFDFTPRSQLNPHRKLRPKTEDIDRTLLARRRDSRIVIHIMKAHNLPLRADGTLLEPFVQACFVSEAAYTRSEVGSNPSWFQSLELPFQPLNFEEDTLGMIDDDVIISLYDKFEVQMAPSTSTTAAVAHETHYRTERRLIGTLHIPFYALHQASQARIEGVYPLRMPRWLLGYDTLLACNEGLERETAGQRVLPGRGAPSVDTATPVANPFGGVEHVPANSAGESSVSFKMEAGNNRQTIEPTVQLYMSLWPPLQREPPPALSPAELTRKVDKLIVSPQLRYLHHVALRWQQAALKRVKAIGKMNAQASTRHIEPFVACSTGDVMLVCRYLLPRGGPPPPSVRTVYEAIRYVSLLPLVTDMMPCGDKNVWSTNAELLVMRSGDYEELAMLLVHFLRHLAPDRPTYAVLGSGTIYKQTILVLHAFNDTEWVLIDPRSGRIVSAGKPYGTALRDVYMVVSHDQIWANVQLSGFPHRMTWDLSNPAHWLPCFDKTKDEDIARCTPHLFPIQREALSFPPANPVKSREVELELRALLKKALLTWRNSCPPAYHRGVETILRTLLVSAEEERCTYGSAWRSDITLSAAARLSEYFGEEVTGELEKNKGAAQHHRHHHHHRRRRANSSGAGAEEDRSAGDDTALQPSNAAAAPSRVNPLRLIGSPVMGSYNPYDPQFQELLQGVFECAVHEVSTSDVSFAIGTYVKSYTDDVCAMWAFVVAICRT